MSLTQCLDLLSSLLSLHKILATCLQGGMKCGWKLGTIL